MPAIKIQLQFATKKIDAMANTLLEWNTLITDLNKAKAILK